MKTARAVRKRLEAFSHMYNLSMIFSKKRKGIVIITFQFENFNSKLKKRQLQKDREDEKAEGYVPDEGTRKNPRKTTK